jgi:hypothetical protein
MSEASGSDGVELTASQVQVAASLADRLARYSSGFNKVARSVALLVSVTGLAALVVGYFAWRDEPVAIGVVAFLCLPAWLAPLRVLRRSTAMAASAADPDGVIRQAKDLIRGLVGSHELAELDHVVRNELRGQGDGARGLLMQARTYRKVGRLIATVIGRASPDPKRHALLVPFTPSRLAETWRAVTVSIWGLGLACLVIAVSIPAIVVHSL